MMRKIASPGFTLVEILVVLGLAAFIATFALTMGFDAYRGHTFRSDQALLLSLLQKARSQSMNNINQSGHGVHLENDEYVLYEGNGWNLRDQMRDVRFLKDKQVAFSGMSDIYFSALSGEVVSPGMVEMRDGSHRASFVINNVGQIDEQ